MTIHRHVLAAGALAIAALLASPAALALRCHGEVISEGAPAYAVRKACGVPDHVTRLYDPAQGERGAELWYYDLGYGRLLRELQFRHGRLRRISTVGADISHAKGSGSCEPTQIFNGMTSYELLVRCGGPIQRETRYERVGVWRNGRLYGYREAWVEIWYYDFDDGHIDRRVRIVDGRVASVDTVD